MPDITYVTIDDLTEATDAQMIDTNEVEIAVDGTSTFNPRKASFSRLGNYFLNKFRLSLGGSSQTVKAAIDSMQTLLNTLYDGIANASHNNSISIVSVACAGYVTTGSTSGPTQLTFFIPYSIIGGTATCTNLAISVRLPDGGYPFARSGSSGGTYTRLNSSSRENYIWSNGSSTRAGEIDEVTCATVIRSGIRVVVKFTNPLAQENGDTTNITNNTPVSVLAVGDFTIT